METDQHFDSVVCGSCVVDMLVRPLPLCKSIVPGQLYEVEPIELEAGGIVSNSGATLAKLGHTTAAGSLVGDDQFGEFLRAKYKTLGISDVGLETCREEATSTTAVLIDEDGERTFAHCVGAPRRLDREWFIAHQELFKRSRSAILGYYSLMPRLEADLPEVLSMLRKLGCVTVLETAGSGGSIEGLAPSLAEVDIYIPSYQEACNQTGCREVDEILAAYRDHGAQRVLGVKLGERGAVISPEPGTTLKIAPAQPPGPVVDTTGAGDAFLAGYVAGTLRGLSPEQSGRLAAAAGACCVTGLGASEGLRDFVETARVAGLEQLV